MDHESAEAAARVHAQSVVDGDYGTMVRGMTPEGLAKAMAIGNTTWKDFGYELQLKERAGDDYVFLITYHTDIGPLTLRERFRLVDGAWKVVDVERAGP